MDDLISKLQNVLNDEESMKQIHELAGMLSNERQENHDPPPAAASNTAASPAVGQQAQSAPDFSNLLSKLGGMLSGANEAAKNSVPPVSANQSSPAQNTSGAPDLSALIAGLSGASGKDPSQGSAPQNGFDIGKLLKLQTIMAQSNKSDKNVELLLALKPLLKEENQVKIDRLIKIFKFFAVYPALKESGLLGGDLFGLL